MGLERLGIFFDPNTTSFLIRLEKCNSWLPRSPDALSSSHGGERGIVKTIGWWSLLLQTSKAGKILDMRSIGVHEKLCFNKLVYCNLSGLLISSGLSGEFFCGFAT